MAGEMILPRGGAIAPGGKSGFQSLAKSDTRKLFSF
jgi:hypothetical protein